MTFDAATGAVLTDGGFYIALFLGLCLGSLATALAYRLPRGISMIARERSHCPACDRPLGVLDLVPVFSWLALRGRCRGCKKYYGLRYLGIECATLALCLAFYFLMPAGAPVLAMYLAAPALVAMTAIDFEWQILPDKLNAWLAAMAGLAIVLQTGLLPLDDWSADWGAAGFQALLALGGAFVYAITALVIRAVMQWRMGQEPLGLGDIKFFAAAGFWLGPDPMRFAIFMMVAGFAGIFLGLAWRRWKGEGVFPFGPALIFAFIAFLLVGESLVGGMPHEYGNMF